MTTTYCVTLFQQLMYFRANSVSDLLCQVTSKVTKLGGMQEDEVVRLSLLQGEDVGKVEVLDRVSGEASPWKSSKRFDCKVVSLRLGCGSREFFSTCGLEHDFRRSQGSEKIDEVELWGTDGDAIPSFVCAGRLTLETHSLSEKRGIFDQNEDFGARNAHATFTRNARNAQRRWADHHDWELGDRAPLFPKLGENMEAWSPNTPRRERFFQREANTDALTPTPPTTPIDDAAVRPKHPSPPPHQPSMRSPSTPRNVKWVGVKRQPPSPRHHAGTQRKAFGFMEREERMQRCGMGGRHYNPFSSYMSFNRACFSASAQSLIDVLLLRADLNGLKLLVPIPSKPIPTIHTFWTVFSSYLRSEGVHEVDLREGTRKLRFIATGLASPMEVSTDDDVAVVLALGELKDALLMVC